MNKLITIESHFLEQQKHYPEINAEVTDLLNDVAFASKLVRREVVRAGLADILGMAGSTNIQGEEVKKLDLFANEKIINAIGQHGRFAIMGSEENDSIIIPPKNETGNYALLFDPLDGSSNIDVNVSVGTIFSIYRLKSSDPGKASLEDCLQSGAEQVAAGYVIYGSSVVLVYTTGHGVHGFTYDPTIGEFLLSHESIVTPAKGKYYSINEGSWAQLNDGTKRYLDYLKEEDPATGRPYSTRYIGSLVADFHRNLLTGGVFVYPATSMQRVSSGSCTKPTLSHSSANRPAAGLRTATAGFSASRRKSCISVLRSTSEAWMMSSSPRSSNRAYADRYLISLNEKGAHVDAFFHLCTP